MDAKKLAKAFPDYVSPYDLYRSTYKYTACGPTVGMVFKGKDRPLYCSDLPGKWTGNILEIHVSSIVEGVDQCTTTHIVPCKGSLKSIAAAYEKAVEEVDAEANTIWNETHGCPGCAKRYGMEFRATETPVHPECKKCGGSGYVY